MTRQNLDNGTWFDRSAATEYTEDTWWDGKNHISKATGSQWDHEELYKTAKGKWVKRWWSQWQGSGESWEIISEKAAYTWLIKNGEPDAVPPEFLAAQEI